MTRRTPRPFIMRVDGTILDRATETIVGRVWRSNLGWMSENNAHRFGPYGTRWYVAQLAWEDSGYKRLPG